MCQLAGRPDAAEAWYQKAIHVGRQIGDPVPTARALGNLAILVRNQPHRLSEARDLAEEALSIKQTLDPNATEIWSTYNTLAEITDEQSSPEDAVEYRRQAREAKRKFPGTRHELQRHAELITATVAACSDDEQAAELVATHQEKMRQCGPDGTRSADALDRLLSGDRDADALCDGLSPIEDEAMIIEAILAGLLDPSSLSDLLVTDD